MIGLLGKGLNSGNWRPIEEILSTKNMPYKKLTDHWQISSTYTIIFSLGYDRIIPENFLEKPKFGVAVFHSSDLPLGRGWAPLFYTIVNQYKVLVQTLFYADKGVDSGPIIAKAQYPISEFMAITDLRIIDDYLTCVLFEKNIGILSQRKVKACAQNDCNATYWKRRKLEDSRIHGDEKIEDLYNFMRALPKDNPAFFERNGVRIELNLSIKNRFIIDPVKVAVKNYFSC